MTDVSKFSDAEIRKRLMEFGFPALPMTATTRKVMVKKLELLLNDQKRKAAAANSDGRRSLGKFSSEEDSDMEVKAAKNKRRVTMAAPPMQPPPAKPPTLKKTTRIVETTIEEDVPNNKTAKPNTPAPSSSRSSKIVRKAQDEFDTGSESESEILRNSNNLSEVGRNSKTYSFNSSGTTRDSPKKTVTLDTSYSKTFSSGERPSAFSSPISTDPTTERLNQIRSRLSLGTTASGDRTSSYTPSTNSVGIDKADTPFLSNFTKRLSQLSSAKTGDYNTYKNDVVKEHDTNGSNLYSRTSQYVTNYRPTTIRSREYQTYDQNKQGQNGNLKNKLVQFVFHAAVVLFFILIGLIYLSMRSSNTEIEPAGVKVPICDSNNPNHSKGVNCLLENDVKNALNLLKPLKEELKERGVKKICHDTKIKNRMEDKDVVDFVTEKFKVKDEKKILNDLRNLQVLVLNNPSWGLSIVQAAADEDITEKHIVKSLDKLGFERFANPIALTFLDVKDQLPWTCNVTNKFYLVAKTTLTIAILFVTVYSINYAYKRYRLYQTERQNETLCLVEKILDLLQNEAALECDNFLVINHVRDMLIPVNERKAKEEIWKRAVEFINENESRVRTENQIVQGEEYYVWRWVGSSNLSLRGGAQSSPKSNNNKSWQGQAFETQTGSVNSLPCSPTPCLKVRGMVEDGDRDTRLIREAVLSKCAEKCKILHCAVDAHMKCAYLKCADTGEAAVAYRNLHGWWYAGQLVTVKYLRLERYMQRFPDSPASGPPYLKATISGSDGWTS